MQMKSLIRAMQLPGLGSLSAVTAIASLVAITGPAEAAVVYSGPVSIAIPDNIDGIYLNLVTGAVGTSSAPAGWDINPYSAAAGQFNLWGATTTTWFSPSGVVGGPYPLAASTSIAGAATTFFRPGGSLDVGTQVTLNAPNLFGVRFTNESAGSAINFAWVEITFGATASDRAITAWAYENSGAPILAGVVPEPSAVALWLVGLVGLGGVVSRRRKQPLNG